MNVGNHLSIILFSEENGGRPLYAYEFLRLCEKAFTKFLSSSASDSLDEEMEPPPAD